MTSRPERILLVEDDEDDRFFMQLALQRAAIVDPLQVVNNGREAIAYLSGDAAYADRAKFPLPTVIFLDLKMPYLGGFEVLEWIRSRPQFAAIAIIVLTSSAEERDHKRAYQLGARSYLLKPPSRDMILEVWKALALRPEPRS